MKRHTRHLRRLIRQHIGRRPLRGAEIGVWRGENAYHLLERFGTLHMTLVDPYIDFHGQHRMGSSPAEAKAEATQRLQPFAARTTWHFAPSHEAAPAIPDGSLDFVFLDGNHRVKFVEQDINIWVRKVRSGGALCGHDYGGGHRGVTAAVDRAFGDRVLSHRPSRVWWVLC